MSPAIRRAQVAPFSKKRHCHKTLHFFNEMFAHLYLDGNLRLHKSKQIRTVAQSYSVLNRLEIQSQGSYLKIIIPVQVILLEQHGLL